MAYSRKEGGETTLSRYDYDRRGSYNQTASWCEGERRIAGQTMRGGTGKRKKDKDVK